MKKHIAGLLVGLVALVVGDVQSQQLNFDEWLNELKKEAAERGISEQTINEAFSGVAYVERVISADRKQAEFRETYEQYLSKRVSEYRINKGKEYLEKYGEQVEKVTSQYGVPARFVVAIIGIETNYGSFTLKDSAFNMLATLAYDPRRGDRFRAEIFAALKIVENGNANVEQLKSSWAGALGIPQFMPSTYLQFAQDFDGDGQKNIWQHGPDLWASVANYLAHYGWDGKKAWARKVVVPSALRKEIENRRDNLVDIPKACVRYKKHLVGWSKLSTWNDLGVRRLNLTELPKVDISASLILSDPGSSQGYLVYENFCTLMRYNPSFKYALSVGTLSDYLK